MEYLTPKAPADTVAYLIDWANQIGDDPISTFTLTVTSGTVTLAQTPDNDGTALRALIAGGANNETAVLTCSIVTSGGQSLTRTLQLKILTAAQSITPATCTKQTIVDVAFEEAGLAGYTLDATAAEQASALRRLDMMMAQWLTNGLDLNYNAPTTVGAGALTDASGIPDDATYAVAGSLARLIAPGIGKTMGVESKVSFASAMNALRARYTVIPGRGLKAGTPRGAGHKPGDAWWPYGFSGGDATGRASPFSSSPSIISGITAPTLTVTGSIPTGAPAGTVVGAITTNYGSATAQIISAGGLAITASGTNIVVNRPRDIMLQRFASVSGQALIAAGVMAPGSPALTIGPASAVFSITEPLGSIPTLTVTRAGGALTCVEFNAPLTPLDVITASGGTGPYRFSVITDGSPMEVIALTSSTAQFYMTGWQDSTVAASKTCRVRAQDSAGHYGYLDVTVTITAFAPSQISGLITVDPANTTTSSGVVTGINLTQGATNYLLKVPSGATAPTLSTVTGPDSVSRPTLVFSDSQNARLACGNGIAGSSSTLAPLFNQTGFRSPSFTMISVINTSPANSTSQRVIMAAYNKAANGGTWAANYDQGIQIGTASGHAYTKMADDDCISLGSGPVYGGSANHKGLQSFTAIPTGWQRIGGYGDGAQCFNETDVPNTDPYNNAAPDFSIADPYPITNTLTCDTVQIGGGFSGTEGWSLAYGFLSARTLSKHERQQLHAWLARKFPSPAYVGPARKATSTMAATYATDFSDFVWGDGWFWLMDSFARTKSIRTNNNEIAICINERFGGLSSVFPEKAVYYDSTKGALQLLLQPLTSAQQTWFASNHTELDGGGNTVSQVPFAPSYYTWRSSGIALWDRFAQKFGYFEMESKHPRARGGWTSGWLFPRVGGPFELDIGETNTGQPGFSSNTLHHDDGSAQTGYGVPCDDLTTNWTRWGVDWRDNLDGTHTIQFYMNREPSGPAIIEPAAKCVKAMTLLLDITAGNAGIMPSSYTTANAPHYFQVRAMRAWSYVDLDVIQPPRVVTPATLSGTRGNGNTLTATDATFDWAGTDYYKLSVANDAGGEMIVATSTGVDENGSGTYTILTTPHSITDQTAWLGKTLIWEHYSTNPTWPSNPIQSRAIRDPATLPTLALRDPSTLNPTTSIPHGVAAGTLLAYITAAAMGAAVSVSGTDYVVGPDGRKLFAGSTYAALAAGAGTIPLTQTPRYGASAAANTISITRT